MRIKLLTAAIISTLLLSACNSDNSAPASATQVGVLSDSYVKGVTYSAAPSGKSGATGANGEFDYVAGDTVTFKIGSVTLGSVNMASTALGLDSGRLMVRPKDLAGVTDETDEKALAVAQFIQTAAAALPSDARIDVSGNTAKFTTVDTVTSLDKVATLSTAAGLTPVSLEKVSEHLLNAATNVKTVEFTPTDITGLSDANRAITYTTSTVKVTYADGSSKTFPLSYVNLFNNTDTNKTADGSAAATIRDKNGVILKDANNNPFVPQTPDANSLLSIGGIPYLVTHWEYENNDSAGTNQYGKVPMTMTVAKLAQSATDGKMTVDSIKQVNFSGVNGLWIPCAGSRSPWNTHLGSEEYEPDARCDAANGDATYAASSSCTAMEYTARMNAFRNMYGIPAASPYNYGITPEVIVAMDGSSTVQKWYTLGRLSREKVQFFADSRTAIQGDDGTYTMLTMFVADVAKDLSAGTLYAAKWNQLSPDGTDGGKATLSWIKLGHATNAEIKAAVDAGLKFSDLFEVDTTGGATAAAGFTRVKHGHEVATVEDLKLKTGTIAGVSIDTLAAFLETRRYAALKGATVEFEKFEGVAYNARDNKAYVAMARMSNGMENKAVTSTEPVNDIRLKKNSSGAVYQLGLQSGWFDTTGTAINSTFVPVVMEALVIGEDMTADADGNKSKLDKIASPDNVFFSERMRVLFIGEDSSNHVNNYLWAYHVDSGKLVRILSLPMGAESTGLQVVDNMNGHAYIMSNYQHAADQNSTTQATFDRIKGLINANKAEVGYLGGLPAIR
jgi:hypothetical protein